MEPTATDDIQEVAGIVEQGPQEKVPSTLEGLGPDYIVEVLNPLKVPFRAKFARSVIQTPQMNANEAEHARKMASYGIPMNKENPQNHAETFLVLQPGQTLKLPGDVAQVVVRQLVNTILQRTRRTRSLADTHARKEIEKDIIQNYTAIVQATETGSPQESFDRQLEELNNPKGAKHVEQREPEQAFPDYTEAATTSREATEPAPARNHGIGGTEEPTPERSKQAGPKKAPATK